METTLVLLFFAILLANLLPFMVCQSSQNSADFNQFLKRLEESKDRSSDNIPPCWMKDDVIENLKKTSHKFIDLCIEYDAENAFQILIAVFKKRDHEQFSPISALDRAIRKIFYLYRKSAPEIKYVLSYLEILDPIGLNVYLTEKNVDESTPNFVEFVEEFETKVHEQMFIDKDIQKRFDAFLLRLKSSIGVASNIVSFIVEDNLNQTSAKFKILCVTYDYIASKEAIYSPVTALKETINDVFSQYKESAKKNSYILDDIESVDPIGLNVYLTQENVKNSSPDFIQFVKDFRTEIFKQVGLIQNRMPDFILKFDFFTKPQKPIVVGSNYSLSDFFEFSEGIKYIIEHPLRNVPLPFTLNINVFVNLRATTDRFKYLCVEFRHKSNQMKRKCSPMDSLEKTIELVFNEYKNSISGYRNSGEKMTIMFEGINAKLNDIKSIDPIGFNIFVSNSSDIIGDIKKFHATMLYRVNLFESSANQYIRHLTENRKTELRKISEDIRIKIASEYSPLDHDTIDYFIVIANKRSRKIKMYSVRTYIFMDEFKEHHSKKTDDVQILYDGEIESKEPGHAICIHYQATSQNVLVYDSLMMENLEPRQKQIIRKLYPFHKEIVHKKPKTIQKQPQVDAVYAIMYATMLLEGVDPSENDLKLNTVFGDETLYMRLDILNMSLTEDKHSMFSKMINCVSPKVNK